MQAYGLAADPDDDAEINDEVFDWMGEFQVNITRCFFFNGGGCSTAFAIVTQIVSNYV